MGLEDFRKIPKTTELKKIISILLIVGIMWIVLPDTLESMINIWNMEGGEYIRNLSIYFHKTSINIIQNYQDDVTLIIALICFLLPFFLRLIIGGKRTRIIVLLINSFILVKLLEFMNYEPYPKNYEGCVGCGLGAVLFLIIAVITAISHLLYMIINTLRLIESILKPETTENKAGIILIIERIKLRINILRGDRTKTKNDIIVILEKTKSRINRISGDQNKDNQNK